MKRSLKVAMVCGTIAAICATGAAFGQGGGIAMLGRAVIRVYRKNTMSGSSTFMRYRMLDDLWHRCCTGTSSRAALRRIVRPAPHG